MREGAKRQELKGGRYKEDFPVGPGVKTLCFHSRGSRFNPWSRKFACHAAKKKKKTQGRKEMEGQRRETTGALGPCLSLDWSPHWVGAPEGQGGWQD